VLNFIAIDLQDIKDYASLIFWHTLYGINQVHALLRILHTIHSNTPSCRKSIHC